ncbi:MAG: hypothetical protein SGI83_16695 [Bacteroidota bacterium]|nr:hypothetical protein [Bacteroidota bacterium]
MSKKKLILKLLFTLLLFSFLKPLHAQQNRVDSIITMLQKTISPAGVDSTTFTSAMNLIEKTTLNEKMIAS